MKQTVVTTRIVRRSVKSIKFTTLTLADANARQRIAPRNGEAVVIAIVLSAVLWTALGAIVMA